MMKKLLFFIFSLIIYVSCEKKVDVEETVNTFLKNYDGTIWFDFENLDKYYSEIPDVKFSDSEYFISFFTLGVNASYCEGWKEGITIYDGVKWEIKIIKNDEYNLWFDYNHYGFENEIQYSVTHKYSIDNATLFYSNSNSESSVYYESEKNYSENVLDTGEIIKLDGCMFF